MDSEIDSSTRKGWKACLDLEFTRKGARTLLTGNRHTGPLAVQRPFYPEDGVCHSCILHPPGGVVGGDLLEINVTANPQAETLITTPGATKFYRSSGQAGVQDQHLQVKEGGVLEWFPQDTILFPGAEARLYSRVDIESSGKFTGWEVLCLGLPAVETRFSCGTLLTKLSVFKNNKPLFLDCLRVNGAQDLDHPAGLRSFPVVATFLATGAEQQLLEPVRNLPSKETSCLYGVSLMEDLLVARYLGHSTFAARDLFTEIWKLLRPQIAGRKACVPRIWAT